jgi:hypothetical protein
MLDAVVSKATKNSLSTILNAIWTQQRKATRASSNFHCLIAVLLPSASWRESTSAGECACRILSATDNRHGTDCGSLIRCALWRCCLMCVEPLSRNGITCSGYRPRRVVSSLLPLFCISNSVPWPQHQAEWILPLSFLKISSMYCVPSKSLWCRG